MKDKEAPRPAYSMEVDTPDGKMWVHVAEEDGQPVQVLINIGKAGTNLAAWAYITARMITRSLEGEVGIHKIIEEFSGTTSGRIAYLERGMVCRSGPEGVAIALIRYTQEKYRESKPKGKAGGASIG